MPLWKKVRLRLLQYWEQALKKKRQIALNHQLKKSFYGKDLSGMARVLELGANPNLLLVLRDHPCRKPDILKKDIHEIFSQKVFRLTFLDIIENTDFFTHPNRQKARELFVRYGGQETEESEEAFAFWTDVEAVEKDQTPKRFFCQMASTCQQLEETTYVGGVYTRQVKLPEKCCPHTDCPNRDRSTFGLFYASGRWWRERY